MSFSKSFTTVASISVGVCLTCGFSHSSEMATNQNALMYPYAEHRENIFSTPDLPFHKTDSKTLATAIVKYDEYYQLQQARANKVTIEVAAESVANKIDQNAANRLVLFLSYPNGWDSGRGKALSYESVDGLYSFLEQTDKLPDTTSIFMSSSGNIVLNWNDAKGNLVEIEFFGNTKIDCYTASNDDEFEIQNDAASVVTFLSNYT